MSWTEKWSAQSRAGNSTTKQKSGRKDTIFETGILCASQHSLRDLFHVKCRISTPSHVVLTTVSSAVLTSGCPGPQYIFFNCLEASPPGTELPYCSNEFVWMYGRCQGSISEGKVTMNFWHASNMEGVMLRWSLCQSDVAQSHHHIVLIPLREIWLKVFGRG